MILFMDASSLARIYLAEKGSGNAKKAIKQASAVFCLQSTYLEIRDLLHRAGKDGRITPAATTKLIAEMDSDWETIHLVVPDHTMLRDAAEIGEHKNIPPDQALILASLMRLKREFTGHEFFYCTADDNLAALAQEMNVDIC